MILYHGSKEGIKGDIAIKSRPTCDFGQGFYLGSNILQAKTLVCNRKDSYLYEFNLELESLKVLKIEDATDWILLIAFNRKFLEDYKDYKVYKYYKNFLDSYDIVCGRIANDRLFDALNYFLQGTITDEVLLKLLLCIDLGFQYVCKSSKAVRCLKLIKSYKLANDEKKSLEEKRLSNFNETNRIFQTLIVENRRKGLYLDELIKKKEEELKF